MTKKLILALYILLAAASHAQESNSVFNFLEMPVSAHSTALGGRNISLIEDDASLVFSNPALLSSVSDKTLNLNFMTYLQGCNVGSAAFVKSIGRTFRQWRHGAIVPTTAHGRNHADNVTVGSFSAMDMALSGMYAYNLNDRWAGGATGKFIYSKYGDYSSVALAVDLGVNYYNENTDFSLSAVARNLGGQVKAFGEIHEKLPFSMQIGFTKGFDHAPFRVSVTLVDLTRWDKDYYFASGEELSTSKMLMNHLAAGCGFPAYRLHVPVLGLQLPESQRNEGGRLFPRRRSLCRCGHPAFPFRFWTGIRPVPPVRPVLSSSTRPTACKDRQVLISAYTLL